MSKYSNLFDLSLLVAVRLMYYMTSMLTAMLGSQVYESTCLPQRHRAPHHLHIRPPRRLLSTLINTPRPRIPTTITSITQISTLM